MTDLMQSLLNPSQSSQPHSMHHASSNESFHSTDTQPTAAPVSSTQQNTHVAAAQNNGLPIFDLQSYLSDPSNASLLAAPTKSKSSLKLPSQQRDTTTYNSDVPVPLGTKTSHHVPALNTLCQAKGIPTPVYDLEQQGEGNTVTFSGVVRIGTTVIGSPSSQCWHNKKAAKEGLAESALGVVQDMTLPGRERVTQPKAGPGNNISPTGTTRNWVGMLQEYHNTTYSGTQSPLYQYFSLGAAFSALCTIPPYPTHSFGDRNLPFPTKKAAQAHAAKGAVETLISEGKLNEDGSTLAKKPKTQAAGTATVRLSGQGLQVQKGVTYAQKVADLATLLGLGLAQYHLEATSPTA
ncbi:MAG: hypothetical protein Q9164_004249, partial [Protoblastenia rupestris]